MWVQLLPGSPMEGLPPARYPVSKTGGLRGLGGSTPSPSSRSEAWPSPARQRVASAQAAPPLAGSNPAASASSPRSSAEKSSGFRPHARPFESGRGVHVHDATSFNGRTTGCYPGDAGSTPAVAASCPDRLDGRGRRSLTPETRVRFPLGALHALGRVWDMRPGCLPGEAGSIPVESASRRSSIG